MAAYTAEVLWFRSGQKFVDNRYSRSAKGVSFVVQRSAKGVSFELFLRNSMRW